MPDRLPSLIVLIAFWVPPAMAGRAAAGSVQKAAWRNRAIETYVVMAGFVLAYAAAWYFYNLHRMPPYVPGATMDPRVATPEASRWLALFTSALILPGSALACVIAFRRRSRLNT
jgi:hypothetical protein